MKTLQQILNAVIAETGVLPLTIYSKARHQQVVYARHAFAHLATKMSFSRRDIAKFLGQTVNTTGEQVRRAADRMNVEPEFYRLTGRIIDRMAR